MDNYDEDICLWMLYQLQELYTIDSVI